MCSLVLAASPKSTFPFTSLPLHLQPELRGAKSHQFDQTDPHPANGNGPVCTQTRGDAGTAQLPRDPAHKLGSSNPRLHILQQCFPTFSLSYRKS